MGKVEVLEVKGETYDKLKAELQAAQAELAKLTQESILFYSVFLYVFD